MADVCLLLYYSLVYGRRSNKPKQSDDRMRPSQAQPLRTINTSLHALAGYLDVGNDELFSSSNQWLQEVCKSFENEGAKRTLSLQSAATNS